MQTPVIKLLAIALAGTCFTFTTACKNKENVAPAPTPAAVESQPSTLSENETAPANNTDKPAEAPGNPTDTSEAFSSGLEKTKQISALTDAEKQQLLDATNLHVPPGMTKESLDQAMCTFAAVISLGPSMEILTTDTLIQTACAQSRDLCVSQVAQAEKMTDISMFPADCTATVAETEHCLNAQNEHGADFLKKFPTCNTLTVNSITDPTLFAGVEALNTAPPACATLAEKCPGFLTPLE